MGSIIYSVLGAIGSLVLGGIGWFLTSFYAKPYLDFRNLRGQVHEELVFTGNVAPIKPNDPRYRQVADSLRRLGAKILTTNETDSRLLRWYLSRTGYDLALAGGGLIALANSLTDQHPAHRVIFPASWRKHTKQ
jgi:hypothetical protein